MSHTAAAAAASQQKCTSSQEVNMFGMKTGDDELLIIGHDEARAHSASFAELREAYKKVAPGDAEAWLLRNGAVRVPAGGPVTQTIRVVRKGFAGAA
jgi:hypothetical protein